MERRGFVARLAVGLGLAALVPKLGGRPAPAFPATGRSLIAAEDLYPGDFVTVHSDAWRLMSPAEVAADLPVEEDGPAWGSFVRRVQWEETDEIGQMLPTISGFMREHASAMTRVAPEHLVTNGSITSSAAEEGALLFEVRGTWGNPGGG